MTKWMLLIYLVNTHQMVYNDTHMFYDSEVLCKIEGAAVVQSGLTYAACASVILPKKWKLR